AIALLAAGVFAGARFVDHRRTERQLAAALRVSDVLERELGGLYVERYASAAKQQQPAALLNILADVDFNLPKPVQVKTLSVGAGVAAAAEVQREGGAAYFD